MDGRVATAFVAGAAGGVGEGIVRAALRAGVHVIAASRSEARLARLRAAVPGDARLTTVAGDVGDQAGAERLRAEVLRHTDRIDFAIASLGGWWVRDSLLDADVAEWNAVMHEMLTTHFIFARTFVPVLLAQGGGTYIGIGGGAALLPIRRSSIVSIAGAAQIMLTRALAAECSGRTVRVLELLVNGPVATRDTEPGTGTGWITADDIGGVVAAMLEDAEPAWPAMRTDGPIIFMDPRLTG